MIPRTSPIPVLLGFLFSAFLSMPSIAQDNLLWRQLDPANTVYMQIGEGQVIFELNPLFAPKTSKQFRNLLEENFYRSLSFYRVIDGFVAQGGDESDIDLPNSQPRIEAEFQKERSEEIQWTKVQSNDLFAPETGFIDGFPAARDDKNVWLTHCPGALAMARNNEPDSGSTDFYIVIGQAPRYLDRNLTIFGRVVHGMDVVQRIRRGETEDNGIIEGDEDRSRIKSMILGSEIPPAERKEVYVMDTNSAGFKTYLEARRNRTDDFFHHKPPSVLDICQVPIASRIEKFSSPLP
jgi:peptidylprolyl isomerase